MRNSSSFQNKLVDFPQNEYIFKRKSLLKLDSVIIRKNAEENITRLFANNWISFPQDKMNESMVT